MLTQMQIQELEQAVGSMNMPVWLSDPRRPGCPVVFANRQFAEAFGKGLDEMIGSPCQFDRCGGRNRDYMPERCAACANCQARTTCQVSHRKDGSAFLSLILTQPLFVEGAAVLIAGFQYEFKERLTHIKVQDHAKKLSRIIARSPSTYGPARGTSHDLDVVFLNALLLRFECANTRLKNALIRARTPGWKKTQARYHASDTALHA